MRFSVAAGFIACVASHTASAQDSALVGKYSGDYQSGRGDKYHVVLTIERVEGGIVTGSIERFPATRPECAGEFPLEGTAKDGKFRVRSKGKAGRADDCSIRINADIDGGGLVGKIGGAGITLSK